ncbi:hypothetical protein HDC30_004896 [Pseudomonas sp. JAI115]|nr:hypothetical protein [Pseudomonas sp. JAI115]
MFITHRQAEVNGSLAMLDPDHQGWHFVQKHLMSPWFHTTIARCEEGLEVYDVLFVGNLEALVSVLAPREKECQVKSVQLVSPGWLNGTGDWRMEMLAEVAQSQDGTSLQFTLRDGRHYFLPSVQSDTPLVYSIPIYKHRQFD